MQLDEVVPLSLTVAELNVLFTALAELQFKQAAPLVDRLRQQILAHDPGAFGPLAAKAVSEAPRVNGEAPGEHAVAE